MRGAPVSEDDKAKLLLFIFFAVLIVSALIVFG